MSTDPVPFPPTFKLSCSEGANSLSHLEKCLGHLRQDSRYPAEYLEVLAHREIKVARRRVSGVGLRHP
jgi:hypothetical protein